MPGGFPLGIEVCNGTTIGISSGKGTAITGGNAVYSAYSQLIAATTADACWIMLEIVNDSSANPGGSGDFGKFAIGAGGSEKDFAIDLNVGPNDGGTNSTTWILPFNIPAGSRISAAALNSAGVADVLGFSVTLFDGAMTMMEGCSGIEALNGRTNTNPTSGTPAGTFGSYTQYVAATTKNYLGLFINGFFNSASSNPSEYCIVDIAVGAGGSEKNIVSSMLFSSVGIVYGSAYFIPVVIPAGTRISMRCSTNINALSTGLGLILYGLY